MDRKDLPLIIASGHIDHTAQLLAAQPPALVVLGDLDGYKTSNPFKHDTQLEGRFVHYELKYDVDHFFSRMDYGYELIDPDAGLPEWQKRRNASARAKQKLIDKMKRKRNAR